MAHHYKQQEMFSTRMGEQDSNYAREIRDRNRRKGRGLTMQDHRLQYHCECGRQGAVVVYCRAGQRFAHNCPQCSRLVVLEANPVNPAKRP